LEFDGAWLEVRICAGGIQADGVGEEALKVPAVLEVLEAADNTNNYSKMWDYSRRLYKGEMEMVSSTLKLAKTSEDSRSISLSANVIYKGSCYTLTLFAIKRSQ
jgi:hypothetical protein